MAQQGAGALELPSALSGSVGLGPVLVGTAVSFVVAYATIALLLRFVAGATMAGVYPVGMKLAASWAKGDLGLLIGIVVGALTLGSALPH